MKAQLCPSTRQHVAVTGVLVAELHVHPDVPHASHCSMSRREVPGDTPELVRVHVHVVMDCSVDGDYNHRAQPAITSSCKKSLHVVMKVVVPPATSIEMDDVVRTLLRGRDLAGSSAESPGSVLLQLL